jgi:hypothetical protein
MHLETKAVADTMKEMSPESGGFDHLARSGVDLARPHARTHRFDRRVMRS